MNFPHIVTYVHTHSVVIAKRFKECAINLFVGANQSFQTHKDFVWSLVFIKTRCKVRKNIPNGCQMLCYPVTSLHRAELWVLLSFMFLNHVWLTWFLHISMDQTSIRTMKIKFLVFRVDSFILFVKWAQNTSVLTIRWQTSFSSNFVNF